jgi:hypothetical protein
LVCAHRSMGVRGISDGRATIVDRGIAEGCPVGHRPSESRGYRIVGRTMNAHESVRPLYGHGLLRFLRARLLLIRCAFEKRQTLRLRGWRGGVLVQSTSRNVNRCAGTGPPVGATYRGATPLPGTLTPAAVGGGKRCRIYNRQNREVVRRPGRESEGVVVLAIRRTTQPSGREGPLLHRCTTKEGRNPGECRFDG